MGFVMENNSSGVSWGSIHGEANDKRIIFRLCIMATGHPSTDEMIKARGKVNSKCFSFFFFQCICMCVRLL